MKSNRIRFLLFVSFVWGLTISTQAQDEVLRQRVLHASHLTRIDTINMKQCT